MKKSTSLAIREMPDEELEFIKKILLDTLPVKSRWFRMGGKTYLNIAQKLYEAGWSSAWIITELRHMFNGAHQPDLPLVLTAEIYAIEGDCGIIFQAWRGAYITSFRHDWVFEHDEYLKQINRFKNSSEWNLNDRVRESHVEVYKFIKPLKASS